MSTEFFTTSPGQTKKLGEKLAKNILKEKNRAKAKVLGLVGDLGGGKTTFIQGMAKGFDITEKVLSPTFILIRKFEIRNPKFETFYHLDCYRIKNSKELFGLGFKQIISDPKNIVAVEWADRVKKILPQETTWLNFKFIDNKTRQIALK